jgi:transcription factor SPT20
MTVRHSTRVYCGARLIYHFYPGCMIVELLDYRPQRNKEPNAETLWADICSLNQKYGGNWSDEEALELEARLLVSIHPKSRH